LCDFDRPAKISLPSEWIIHTRDEGRRVGGPLFYPFRNSFGSLAMFLANSPRLGQRHLALELLQMRGHNRPSQGLWPLWRIELDLESDGDGG
jgi:hypothetical protein